MPQQSTGVHIMMCFYGYREKGQPAVSWVVYIMICFYCYLGRGAADVSQDVYHDVFLRLPR